MNPKHPQATPPKKNIGERITILEDAAARQAEAPSTMKRAALILLGVGVIVGIATALSFPFLRVQYEQRFIYPALRTHINNHLTDPGSTQYRNEFMGTTPGWLCGELNSKSPAGGYTGFKRYMAHSADDAYLEGTGPVGRYETTEEMQARLQHAKELMKKFAELGAKDIPFSEAMDTSRQRAFDDRWEKNCKPAITG